MLTASENVNKSLSEFREMLVKANQVQNLVSRKSVDKIVDDLIRESLLPLEWAQCLLASPVLDVGSGGGFPGVPLRLARPDLAVHLLDSQGKKCAWLETVKRELALDNVTVLYTRAENFATHSENQARYGTVLSRATASLKDLLKWSKRLLRPGGELVVWKGSSLETELARCDWRGWSQPETWQQPSGLILLRLQKN